MDGDPVDYHRFLMIDVEFVAWWDERSVQKGHYLPTTTFNHSLPSLDLFGSDLDVLLKTPLAYELHAYVNESSKTSKAKVKTTTVDYYDATQTIASTNKSWPQ